MISTAKHYLSQILGWHTSRRIIVIESDDWGSIRMPSREVYQDLLSRGIHVDNCAFSRYDSLETEDDLSALFDVLASTNDSNGNSVVMTANSVVANPDFKRISEERMSGYFYEPVTVTYKNYPGCEHSYELIQQGITQGVWRPQFHGREHLNGYQWIKALQAEDEITTLSFHQKHFGLTKEASSKVKTRYMDAFANYATDSLEEERLSIIDGTRLFKELYGYESESFIAPCYTWRNELEETLASVGVKYIQGLAYQQLPYKDSPVQCKSVYHYLGEKNSHGQRYLIRNAFFEPYKGDAIDWVDECLSRINIAFKCHKPAIISTHRLNFIGTLDKQYRDNNLFKFKTLLSRIVKKWQEVEFMSSDTLGQIISNHNIPQ